MAKRFCKLNRRDIAANLGEIHSLVTQPKYMCRSCARSSASKDSLCKPAAIPPASCQSKPLEERQACGLLAEALGEQTVAKDVSVKPQTIAPVPAETVSVSTTSQLSEKAALKKAKKTTKKQKKYLKALKKVFKKQRKLMKKKQKLEQQLKSIAFLQKAVRQENPSQPSVH